MRLWLLRQAHPDLSKLELEVSTSCLSKISLLRLLLGQTNRDKDFPESLRYSGRPNIYGGSNVVGYASPNVDVLGTGAFSAMTRWVSSLQISTDGTNASSIQFDAGNSNHLYGLSGTVQPAGIYGLLLLKAY